MNESDMKTLLEGYKAKNNCNEAAVLASAKKNLPQATLDILANAPDFVICVVYLVMAHKVTYYRSINVNDIIAAYDVTNISGVWDCYYKGNIITLTEDATLDAIYLSQPYDKVVIQSFSKKPPTLTITQSDYMQPAIGTRTRTNMSYGRWTPGEFIKFKIYINNVHVVIENSNDCFTLGTYNYDSVPEIDLLNGGSLDCPEMKGHRYLIRKAIPPQGSTKISALPKYKIGENFTQEQLELIEQLVKLVPAVEGKFDHTVEPSLLSMFISIAEYYPGRDITPYLGTKNVRRNTKDSVILGFSNVQCDDLDYQLQLYDLYDSMCKDTVPKDEKSKVYATIFDTIASHIKPDCPQYCTLLYTLIPPYDLIFTGKSHEECIDEYKKEADDKYRYLVDMRKVYALLSILPNYCLI